MKYLFKVFINILITLFVRLLNSAKVPYQIVSCKSVLADCLSVHCLNRSFESRMFILLASISSFALCDGEGLIKDPLPEYFPGGTVDLNPTADKRQQFSPWTQKGQGAMGQTKPMCRRHMAIRTCAPQQKSQHKPCHSSNPGPEIR